MAAPKLFQHIRRYVVKPRDACLCRLLTILLYINREPPAGFVKSPRPRPNPDVTPVLLKHPKIRRFYAPPDANQRSGFLPLVLSSLSQDKPAERLSCEEEEQGNAVDLALSFSVLLKHPKIRRFYAPPRRKPAERLSCEEEEQGNAVQFPAKAGNGTKWTLLRRILQLCYNRAKPLAFCQALC